MSKYEIVCIECGSLGFQPLPSYAHKLKDNHQTMFGHEVHVSAEIPTGGK